MSSLEAIKNLKLDKKEFIILFILAMVFSLVIFIGDYTHFFEAQKGDFNKELTHLVITLSLVYLFYFQSKYYQMGYFSLHLLYTTVIEMLHILGKLNAWHFVGIPALVVLGVWHVKGMGSQKLSRIYDASSKIN